MKTQYIPDLLKSVRFLGTTAIGALLAFLFRYAENWVFDPVEPDTIYPGTVLTDPLASVRVSRSPERQMLPSNQVEWRIVTVTNRTFTLRELAARAGSARLLGGTSQPPLHPASSDPRMATEDTNPPPLTRTVSRPVIQTVRDQSELLQYNVPETQYVLSSVFLPGDRQRGALRLAPEHVDGAEVWPEETLSRSAFLHQVQSKLTEAGTQDVLVFVHGFNVSLSAATARAAQMAEDMPFHGVIIPFSWPSAGKADGYADDELVAERYFWNLAELLADLHTSLPEGTRLHLLAHSMGNRVALRALGALAGKQHPVSEALVLNRDKLKTKFPGWSSWDESQLSTPPLSTLILAAPDVAPGEFKWRTEGILYLAQSTILYTSDSDVALEGSSRVHGNEPRAGDTRADLQIDGIRILRVSGVNHLDPLGHSYYGSNPQILNQLSQLFLMSRPVRPVGL
ncbi:MAG: alpha/beta fold hydrolase [Planctomycetaceae bacterium]|nr:alpha/beta fold hydrolase [Planctomycetaceae bacterium]